MAKRRIKSKIHLAVTVSTVMMIAHPHMVYANAVECAVETMKPEDKAVNDFGAVFKIDDSAGVTSAIKDLAIKKTSLVDALGISDPNVARAQKNEAMAKGALDMILKTEADPEAFQKTVDQLSKYIRGSLNVKEAEQLAASHLLDVKLAEMKSLDDQQRIVEGDMKSLLKQFRQLNPDVSDHYKEKGFVQNALSSIPFIGKKAAQSASERANALYERTTSARQAIIDSIGAVKANGKTVEDHLGHLKTDRVALINLAREYDATTARLIAIDKVFHEYLRDNTKDTDAVREFFTRQILKPVREILLDIENMKDSVNTALLLNFELVQRGQQLVDRTARMADRLTVDFFTTITNAIAMDQQTRQTLMLNDAELASAQMKANIAEQFKKYGIEIRNEEAILDQVTQIIKDKNKAMEDEMAAMNEYDQRITSKLAKISKERADENDRLKAAILRLEKGEQIRMGGVKDAANTYAAAIRDSMASREAAVEAVKEVAKIQPPTEPTAKN